jgi:hypothetical protein
VKRQTKNIAAVALLALAGGAFLVDRFVIGYTPAAAGAAVDGMTAAAPPTPATAAVPAPRASTAAAASGASITMRVAHLSTALQGKGDKVLPGDAFVIPAAWRTTIAAPAEASVPAHLGEKTAPPTALAGARLELTAVLTGTQPAAVINGRIVKIGRKISGYELRSVSGNSRATAVLAGPSGELTLTTKTDDNIRMNVPSDADDALTVASHN